MTLRFAFYEPEHFDALAVALSELYEHYFPGVAPPAPETIARHLADDVLAADSGVRVALALDGAQAAGFATVSLLYPAPAQRPQLFMKDLFVRRSWRSQGVGDGLMRFLARHAVERNCVRFDWTTELGNHRAMAFYDRLGAARVEEKVYYRLTGAALEALARGG